MITANNRMPLVVGGKYLLMPGIASTNWTVITEIRGSWVYVEGLDDNTSSFRVPIWQFDDLVSEYEIDGELYTREDGVFELITNDGKLITF